MNQGSLMFDSISKSSCPFASVSIIVSVELKNLKSFATAYVPQCLLSKLRTKCSRKSIMFTCRDYFESYVVVFSRNQNINMFKINIKWR